MERIARSDTGSCSAGVPGACCSAADLSTWHQSSSPLVCFVAIADCRHPARICHSPLWSPHYVCLTPCRQFLAELSKIAEVVLFTAASEAYAQPLVNLLDPHHNIFVSRLFSSSCCRVCGKEGVKDLSGLGRDLSRVVLVDNSPYSFMLQPSNGLPCLPFHGHSSDKQVSGTRYSGYPLSCRQTVTASTW